MHDEALLLRIDWNRVSTDLFVEAMFLKGQNAEIRAHLMKGLCERKEPGYTYAVIVRERFETKGVHF